MSSNNTITIGGGGISSLFIIFLVLKLCHVIDWSWWWVTSPIWIPMLVSAVFIIPYLIILIVINLINK